MSTIRLRTVVIGVVISICLPVLPTQAGEAQDKTRLIAVSGDAGILSIEVIRRRSAGSKDADVNYTIVEVALPTEKRIRITPRYLAQLHDLDPIIDDTGHTLSSKKRMGWIDTFRHEFIANKMEIISGQRGPVISLTLDNPARAATKIRAIKGKITVSPADLKELEFDLPKAAAKRLEHEALKEVEAKPSLKIDENGNTLVTLRATKGNGRINSWGVVLNGRPVSWFHKSTVPLDPVGFECTLSFRGALPEGSKLWLDVAVPLETKTFDFHFKDVELP